MAQGDILNTEKVSFSSGELTIGFTPTPNSGSLLIVLEPRSSTHGAGGAWDVPAGWTGLHDSGISTGNMAVKAYAKISDGTETQFGPTAHTNESGNGQAVMIEVEGPFDASFIDQQAEDMSNLSTVVKSQSTGTTPNTSQANEFIAAMFAFDALQNIDLNRAYTNSFVEQVIGDLSAARATGIIATKVVSAIGPQECTFSCDATEPGDEGAGLIATFRFAGGAAPTVKKLAALGVG